MNAGADFVDHFFAFHHCARQFGILVDESARGIVQLAALLAIARARVPLTRDLVFLATADEEAGSRFGAQWVADERRAWLAGAEYALSELGAVEEGHGGAQTMVCNAGPSAAKTLWQRRRRFPGQHTRSSTVP